MIRHSAILLGTSSAISAASTAKLQLLVNPKKCTSVSVGFGVDTLPFAPPLAAAFPSPSSSSPSSPSWPRRCLAVRCCCSSSGLSGLILGRRQQFNFLKRKNCLQYISDMDGCAGSGLFPLHRCKTIHLVRHAQGIHNVEGEKDHKAYLSPELFDAHLTQLGWDQVDNLRKHVNSCGLSRKIDLVITSPLLRTMQTAVGVFGGENYSDGVNVPTLMVENTGKSGRPAISSLNCPPFIAVEYCREHLGVHPCDKRRSVSEYRRLFPAIDFSLIEDDDDVLWKPDVRESNEEVAARGVKFINWLWTRKEKEIVVVSHSGFLFHTLKMFGNDCHPTIKEEISKHFANCELRSMTLVDRSMLGFDSRRCDYPGKIPHGLDLPSDVAEEKQPEKGS